ncbi:MAG: hypothetical protein AB1Z98_20455 [Nannocystaceae bacterium]
MWTGSTSPTPTFLVVLLATGCGPTVISSDDGTGSEGGGSTSPMVDTLPPPPSTSTTTATTTAGSVTLDGTDGPMPPLDVPPGTCTDLGSSCAEPSDCCTGQCYVAGPLGGVCSECDQDSDCGEYGCDPGSPVEGIPAVCGDGGLGSGCDNGIACQPDLVCNTIVDVPGILETNTCGECAGDLDCPAGQLCAPEYELSRPGGYWYCASPMSLPDTAGCDAEGSGDLQCASGNCAVVVLMGIPLMGVCSVCDEDADCRAGRCILPELVIDGELLVLEPGACG